MAIFLRPDTDNPANFGKMERPANYKDLYKTALAYCDSVISSATHTLSLPYYRVFVNECNYVVNSNDDPIFEIPFAKETSGNVGYVHGPKSELYEGSTSSTEMSELWACLAALIVYVIIVMLCSWLSQKSTMLRRFLTGKSIVIFDRGKLYKKNFSVAKIDINEFLTRMREKAISQHLDDVKTVFLNRTARCGLSKDERAPATPDDLKIILAKPTRVRGYYEQKFSRKILPNRAIIFEWLKNSLTKRPANSWRIFFLGVCDDTENLKSATELKARMTV